MNVLFVADELFLNSNNGTTDMRAKLNTGGGSRDSDFTRASITNWGTGGGGTEHNTYWNEVLTLANPAFDADVIWMHFRSGLSVSGGDWSGIQGFGAFADASNNRIWTFTKTTSQFKFRSYEDDNSTYEEVTFNMDQNVYYNYDIAFRPATDEISIYQGGTLVTTLSLDLNKRTPGTLIAKFRMNDNTNQFGGFTELFATYGNDPTVGCRLAVLTPDGLGSVTDGTGTETDVNELNLDTATFSELAAAGTQLYTYTDVSANAQLGVEVAAVVVGSVVGASASVVPTVTNVARLNGTNYDIGAGKDFTLIGDYNECVASVSTINPDTGVAWTFADLAAAEFGFKAS